MGAAEQAIEYVLANEGLFVDNPADHGGATFKGVTLRAASGFFKKQMSVQDLKALTDAQIIEFYKGAYWFPMKLDHVIQVGVATALLDIEVNQGQGKAIQLAERAVAQFNLAPTGSGDWQDYIDTINLIDSSAFIEVLHEIVVGRYLGIVKANSSQQQFLNGWLARANKLLTLTGQA